MLSEEAGRKEINVDAPGELLYCVSDPFDGSYLFKHGIPDFWYSTLAFYSADFEPVCCAVGDAVHRRIAFADAANQQYREEIPSTTVTEDAADIYVNDTIGRNDFAVVSFPSYGYVADPEGQAQGKLKLVSLTGMIHGRESRVANDWLGFHKAGAGQDAILPSVLKLPTGEAVLNEEYLNPIGIGVIKKMKGNFVIWGDRTLNLDPTWKWKHQREQMCYYENVLRESFDWIIFAINDPITEKQALAALKIFFLPEWRTKRALQGETFEEAAIIRVDSEINTPVTRAAGDMYAEVSLWLADTVERFIVRISKQGVFETVA